MYEDQTIYHSKFKLMKYITVHKKNLIQISYNKKGM